MSEEFGLYLECRREAQNVSVCKMNWKKETEGSLRKEDCCA